MFESVACQPDPIRVSGTARDGAWTATLTIPKGSVGATYNLEVYAEDQVSNRASWIGPDVYQQWVAGRWCCTPHYPFPDDAGRVEVTGTVADRTPAWIDAVTASKPSSTPWPTTTTPGYACTPWMLPAKARASPP